MKEKVGTVLITLAIATAMFDGILAVSAVINYLVR